MELYPAIDIRAGRVVRLSQGDAGRETSYNQDPVAQAEEFIAAGTSWIHVVDLDRAFDQGDNLEVIHAIVARAAGRCRVQVGGGIRSLDALKALQGLGASRAVLGTRAVIDPGFVPAALGVVGAEGAAIGLDARGGMVAIRGWVETTDLPVVEVCRRVLGEGARTVIYTDVGRDGMLAGPDLDGALRLQGLGARVIASGGVSSVDDLRAVGRAGLCGAIVGRALYEGKFTVADALEVCRNS